MKPIIVDLKDISDSTEVYDSKPNKFISYTIYYMCDSDNRTVMDVFF